MQCRRSCQNSCSIHVFVVPTDVCTHVLYTLIVTVHLSFLSARSEHRIPAGGRIINSIQFLQVVCGNFIPKPFCGNFIPIIMMWKWNSDLMTWKFHSHSMGWEWKCLGREKVSIPKVCRGNSHNRLCIVYFQKIRRSLWLTTLFLGHKHSLLSWVQT